MSTPPPILHATAKNAEMLTQTEWQNLTLSTGWAAVGGHTPRVCKVGQIIFLTGAVQRQGGGYKTSIATIPAGYRPSGTQFIGAGVSSRGTHYELYLDNQGILKIDGYENIGDSVGMILPIAAGFILI